MVLWCNICLTWFWYICYSESNNWSINKNIFWLIVLWCKAFLPDFDIFVIQRVRRACSGASRALLPDGRWLDWSVAHLRTHDLEQPNLSEPSCIERVSRVRCSQLLPDPFVWDVDGRADREKIFSSEGTNCSFKRSSYF